MLPRLWILVSLASCLASAPELRAELRHRWILESEQIKKKEVTALGGQTATLAQDPAFDPSGLLLFDGKQALSAKPKDKAAFWLPTKSFTAEAWVKIDEPAQWGGIVGYQQDNGNYEKGWVLGYSGSNFFFKVSNGPRLHTATAATPFKLGTWHHVAGTYDGTTMRLYVDGALEASSAACSGDIEYPPDAPFAIGAYHDKDEFFPLKGQIREVRLYEGALSPDTITAHLTWARDLPDKSLQLSVPPSLLYTSATSAVVNWETLPAGIGIVEITPPDGKPRTVSEFIPAPGFMGGDRNAVEVENLLPQTEYQIRVGIKSNKEIIWGPSFPIDTTFNFAPPAIALQKTSFPAQTFVHASAAIEAIGKVQRDGFCLVLGVTDGHLAEAILRRSSLRVIALSDDPDKVAKLRRQAYESGIYGERLTFAHAENFSALPYTDRIANLIVTENLSPSKEIANEIARLLHPNGVAYLAPGGGGLQPPGKSPAEASASPDWKPLFPKSIRFKKSTGGIVATRIPSPTDGRWTHQYGDSGNSAFAGESLGGASSTDDLEVQWLGRPGADFGIDRNPRMPAPLAVAGRLFHQGLNRVVALDAHHGTALWTREIPDLRRVNIPRDASNWSADEDHLYVAVKDRAWILDGATGQLSQTLTLPDVGPATFEWGYIANDENHVYGSKVAEGSSYRAFWTKANWFDKNNPESTAKVCSESLFAYSKSDQKLRWQRAGGIIINASITLHENRLYFAESRNPELVESNSGRVSSDALWQNLHLVCLDATSGDPLWERSLESTVGQVVFFLQAAEEKLLLTTSAQAKGGRGEYALQTFDLKTGNPGWPQSLPWRSGDHGAHMQHPVIVGGKVYVEPHGVDFQTGEIVSTKVRPREGCSTAMASANAVFLRGTRRCLTVWSPETESPTHWPRLRPSCWLNMVAAQGLLLVPEGGAGCSCGGWMESSMAFRPKPIQGEGTPPSPPKREVAPPPSPKPIPKTDWPTFRSDNARSGTTTESPTFPLKPSWSRLSPSPPKTAWARPAKWDAYAGNEGLQAMRDFDTAFYVTFADGHAYFASSLDDAIHCLDAKTGAEKWVAFANAPVRLPPTIAGGKAYFGSDDGFAYCVDSKSGDLIWRTRAAPSERLIPSDGRMISPWPVRTGVMVKNDTAYFGASLLPWNESVFFGVDTQTGKPEGENRFRTSVRDVTFQGMLLAASDQILVPQGRAQVLKFKPDGTSAGAMAEAGGVFLSATTAGDEPFLISGPKNQKAREDVLIVSSLNDGALAFSLGSSNRAVATDGILYTHVAGKLTALNLKSRADQERRVKFLKRKAARGITPKEKAELDSLPTEIAKTVRWQIDSPPVSDLIIAGEFLFTATADTVTAHRRDTGAQVWQAEIKGTPLGLAFADKRLYVSTAEGHILTFSP